VISGFGHEIVGNCPLPSYYAASSGNYMPTVWDNLSSIFKEHLKMGTLGFPKRLQEITTSCCVVAQKRPVLDYTCVFGQFVSLDILYLLYNFNYFILFSLVLQPSAV
jgi:hypothetical protein